MRYALLALLLAGCNQAADPAQACIDSQAARAAAAHRLGCQSVRLDCPTGPVFVSDAVACVGTYAGAESCAELDAPGPCDAYLKVTP